MATVFALPNVNITPNNNSICVGQVVTLNASGANTYVWQPGNLNGNLINDTPSTTTTYSIVGTDVNGCVGLNNIVINVNPLPTLVATSSSTDICQGQSITLNASGAITYTWQPGALIGNSVIDSPTALTIYTVTGTDANGCENMSTINVDVLLCTGNSLATNQLSAFKLFPNPTNGALTLEFKTTQTFGVFVEVYDFIGKKIMSQSFNYSDKTSSHQLNLEKFANGFYFIKLKSADNSIKTIKVIKE
jgi:hypothetical protein